MAIISSEWGRKRMIIDNAIVGVVTLGECAKASWRGKHEGKRQRVGV